MLAFHRFDTSCCGFPSPRVPVLPPLDWSWLTSQRSAAPSAVRSAVRSYSRGRYALTEAYRLCGVGAHGALLAPAYHCRTMIDPALALSAEVAFYPMSPHLAPDMQGLHAALSACRQPVKALLATHYFGFPTQLDVLSAFCQAQDIALIEDCSHALVLGSDAATPMGHTGRYGIASFYKFFPTMDGGLLWANDGATLPQPTIAPGWWAELKAIRNAMLPPHYAKPLDVEHLDSQIDAAMRDSGNVPREWTEPDAGVSTHYSSAAQNVASLAASRWILGRTDMQRLAERRRAHYRQWLTAVDGLPGCKALYADLPIDSVPYMFPLLIDHLDPHFLAMKRLGVPIWRWDEMAVSNCPVSARYRTRLLHLPCHQALTADQLAWMTGAVRGVMRHPRRGRAA